MRALAWLVARAPWSWLGPMGAAIGLLAGSLLRIRRRHVEASLKAAGVAPASVIARQMYRSLGAGLVELLWLAGREPAEVDRRFEMSPRAAEALRDAARLGKGVIVATAHTGNWDLSACASARWLAENLGASLTVVTKQLSWRALDRYWQRLRAERGVTLVPAEGAASEVRRALAEGGVVALLVDQAPERASGVTTLPFFGRPAKHDLAPAILAARAKAPVVVLLGRRRDDGTHVMDFEDALMPDELRGADAPRRATARISAAVERFVRAHPAQWLWLHKRWK
jgi:Kdo2-lipid IVA lauroyltransferase/acyltransferase